MKIEYFDPVCSGEWTQEAYLREIHERETSDFVVYVITPKMGGVYSVAEVIDDSNKRPEKTLFCVLETDEEDVFTKAELKSLIAVAKMVKKNGGKVFDNLRDLTIFLNTFTDADNIEHPEKEMLMP